MLQQGQLSLPLYRLLYKYLYRIASGRCSNWDVCRLNCVELEATFQGLDGIRKIL